MFTYKKKKTLTMKFFVEIKDSNNYYFKLK